jgi:hypothetical protein
VSSGIAVCDPAELQRQQPMPMLMPMLIQAGVPQWFQIGDEGAVVSGVLTQDW